MNSSSYVNYFSEIKHLDKGEQQRLLELARYKTFVSLGLSGKSLLNYFIALIVGAIFPICAFVFFNGFALASSTGVAIGVVVSLLIVRWLNGRLLHQGLKAVLSGNGT